MKDVTLARVGGYTVLVSPFKEKGEVRYQGVLAWYRVLSKQYAFKISFSSSRDDLLERMLKFVEKCLQDRQCNTDAPKHAMKCLKEAKALRRVRVKMGPQEPNMVHRGRKEEPVLNEESAEEFDRLRVRSLEVKVDSI